MENYMRKKGWILLLVLLGVAFLMSCGKDMEPDEAKGELVRIEREGCQSGILLFCVCPAKLDYTCRCKSGHGNRQ